MVHGLFVLHKINSKAAKQKMPEHRSCVFNKSAPLSSHPGRTKPQKKLNISMQNKVIRHKLGCRLHVLCMVHGNYLFRHWLYLQNTVSWYPLASSSDISPTLLLTRHLYCPLSLDSRLLIVSSIVLRPLYLLPWLLEMVWLFFIHLTAVWPVGLPLVYEQLSVFDLPGIGSRVASDATVWLSGGGPVKFKYSYGYNMHFYHATSWKTSPIWLYWYCVAYLLPRATFCLITA